MIRHPFSDACFGEEYPDTRCFVTRFYDGTSLCASPTIDRGEYRRMAEDMGYRGHDPAWQCCREHEWLHSWLSVKMGRIISPTLWAEAHGCREGTAGVEQRIDEEQVVLCFQRLLNDKTDPTDRDLRPLAKFGEVETMRGEALRLLRGSE